jgi:uncharacterized membrane protein
MRFLICKYVKNTLHLNLNYKIMIDLNLAPLNNYTFKIFGIGVTVLTLVVAIPFTIFGIESIPTNVFMIFLTMGLVIISTSKEKIEDERIQKIRGHASRVSFTYVISLLVALGITQQFSSKDIVNNPLLIAAFGLCLYIFLFHFSLRKDFFLIDKDETIAESVKRNKGFYMIYMIMSIAIMLLMLFRLIIK